MISKILALDFQNSSFLSFVHFFLKLHFSTPQTILFLFALQIIFSSLLKFQNSIESCLSLQLIINIYTQYIPKPWFMSFLLLLLTTFILTLSSQYNPSIARQLAYYSDIAYQDTDKIKSWTCQRCSQYKVNNVQVYTDTKLTLLWLTLYSNSLQSIILAFRGTKINLDNILTDLNVNPVDYSKCSDCKVHDGFYDSFKQIKTSLLSSVKQITAKYPSSKIYITGHSLGGALAAISLPQIIENFGKEKINGVYTYGQPRVGNKKFAAYFNSLITSYRVIYKKDPVPQVPISSSSFHHRHNLNKEVLNHDGIDDLLNYYHEGKQIWYKDSTSKYKQCDSQSSKCYNSVWKIFLKASDHSSGNYIKISSSSSRSHLKVLAGKI